MSVVFLQGSAVTTILRRWPRRRNCHVAIFPVKRGRVQSCHETRRLNGWDGGRYIMRKSTVWKWGHDSFLVESGKKISGNASKEVSVLLRVLRKIQALENWFQQETLWRRFFLSRRPFPWLLKWLETDNVQGKIHSKWFRNSNMNTRFLAKVSTVTS